MELRIIDNLRAYFLAGFNAYVGYLLLEHTHGNPVLVTFCRLLTKTLNDRAALEMSEDSAKTNHAFHSSSSSKSVFSFKCQTTLLFTCITLIGKQGALRLFCLLHEISPQRKL